MLEEKPELTFDKIAEWPNSIKIFSIVFSCLVICLAFFWFDFKNQAHKLEVAKKHEVTLKKQLADKLNKVQILQATQSQLDVASKLFNNTLNELIAPNNLTSFLSNIAKLAENNQLSLKSLKPLKANAATFYTEIPVEIVAYGSYTQLATFISDLANMKRVVFFKNLAIRKVKSDQQDLEMDMTTIIYTNNTTMESP